MRVIARLRLRGALLALLVFIAVARCGPGASSDAGAAEGGAEAGAPCARNEDCDDGRFCTGRERCAPGDPAADPRGCAPGPAPCPASLVCDERAGLCREGDGGTVERDVVEPGDGGAACASGDRCDCDGDGVRSGAMGCGGTDCDDADRYRYPGNAELCVGLLPDGRSAAEHDEDCDPCTVAGRAPDGDQDGDGFVSRACSNPWPGATRPTGCPVRSVRAWDPSTDAMGVTLPMGSAPWPSRPAVAGLDCNDGAASGRSQNPDAPEVCGNRVDDNCNDQLDERAMVEAFRDFDGDGYGSTSVGIMDSCALGANFSARGGDCDDRAGNAQARATFPGAREACDGVVNDCARWPAGATSAPARPEEDADGDLHTAASYTGCFARGEPGAVTEGAFLRDDCDDGDRQTYQGAPERCDGRDNECEGPDGARSTLPADIDENPAASQNSCGGLRCVEGSCPVAAQLAGGTDHTCARFASGSLWCWGANEFGQLGRGGAYSERERLTPAFVATPHEVSLAALDVAAAGTTTCAVRTFDRSVWCWGSVGGGALGTVATATLETRLYPALVGGLTDAAQLTIAQQRPDLPLAITPPMGAAPRYFLGCARRSDASVWCWGSNFQGQLGRGIAHSEAIYPPAAVRGLTDVRSVAAGRGFACALRGDGTVWCWGTNLEGQLGGGSTARLATEPVAVAAVSGAGVLQGVTELAVGGSFACALRRDAPSASPQVVCWGDNREGQLGESTPRTSNRPRVVSELTSPSSVAAGGAFACVVEGDARTARCWGANTEGQRGGPASSTAARVDVSRTELTDSVGTPRPLVGVRGLALASEHACALVDEGAVCWGANGSLQLGQPTSAVPTHLARRVLAWPELASIEAGAAYTCVRRAAGDVYCWGNNARGQVGVSATSAQVPTPTRVEGLRDVVRLSVGDEHACATRSDGSVWCWGEAANARLGVAPPAEGFVRRPVAVAGVTNAVSVAAGGAHSCALASDGTVRCWGRNERGELGLPAAPSFVTPQLVPRLDGVYALAAGSDHSCALRRTLVADDTYAASVWCWGDNSAQQLGTASTFSGPQEATNFQRTQLSTNEPLRSSRTYAEYQLSLGNRVSCLLGDYDRATAQRSVRCLGSDTENELGAMTSPGSAAQVQLVSDGSTGAPTTLDGLGQVSAGLGHACGFSQQLGAVYCWGSNRFQERGVPTLTLRAVRNANEAQFREATASAAGTNAVRGVASGGNHSCALLAERWTAPSAVRVACWGSNSDGQLGSGATGGGMRWTGVQAWPF